MSEEVQHPCKGCPWLRENQTPAAVAASPVDGRGRHWFERSNLRRHWAAVSRHGNMLPCHETDANAPLYGGERAKGGHGRICVGLTVLAHREVTAYMQAGTSATSYKAARGVKGFTLKALAAWAARLYYAGSTFEVGRDTWAMPAVADDPRCTVPWPDDLHKRRCET